ncbi:MAG: hypothetical protein R3246_13400 [Acidimicrobiia bacterium]|nr:hypothetical protein [Acidimicrobiia bacterium]
MRPNDSSTLLAELTTLRRRTRSDLDSGGWRWMFVWAAVSAGFVVALAVPALHGLAAGYWAFGVPVGVLGTMATDLLHRERRVRRREWPYWATALAITVANVAGSFLLPTGWMLVWLWIVLASGFSVLLWLERERVASRLLAAQAILFAVVSPFVTSRLGASVVMGAVFTLVLVATGWLGLSRERA